MGGQISPPKNFSQIDLLKREHLKNSDVIKEIKSLIENLLPSKNLRPRCLYW